MDFSGRKLRTRRLELGLSQEELARLAGIRSAKSISTWERNAQEPRATAVMALSGPLNVRMDYFFE